MNKQFALTVLAILAVSQFAYRLGLKHQQAADWKQIRLLESKVERFENYTVFTHAQKVARITGTPLYQVLTGKRANQAKAFHK